VDAGYQGNLDVGISFVDALSDIKSDAKTKFERFVVNLTAIKEKVLFPPWDHYYQSESETFYRETIQFRLIFDPLKQDSKILLECFTINFKRLYTRMFAIAIITAGLALTFQVKRQNDYFAVNTKDENKEP